jgi:predicted small integral membrane protein
MDEFIIFEMDEFILIGMVTYGVNTTSTRSRVGHLQLEVTKYSRSL